MSYILSWLICSVCSFYLLKNYVESNLRSLPSPPENIAQAMRNAAKRDETIDPMHDCPDNIVEALFWTILLVESLLIWPINLVTLLWWQIFDKQDFSDFRG
jgi:hypothetical protein